MSRLSYQIDTNLSIIDPYSNPYPQKLQPLQQPAQQQTHHQGNNKPFLSGALQPQVIPSNQQIRLPQGHNPTQTQQYSQYPSQVQYQQPTTYGNTGQWAAPSTMNDLQHQSTLPLQQQPQSQHLTQHPQSPPSQPFHQHNQLSQSPPFHNHSDGSIPLPPYIKELPVQTFITREQIGQYVVNQYAQLTAIHSQRFQYNPQFVPASTLQTYVPNSDLRIFTEPLQHSVYDLHSFSHPAPKFAPLTLQPNFRLQPYRELEHQLNAIEKQYKRRIDPPLDSLPLGSPHASNVVNGMGFPRYTSGTSPILGPVPVPNRKRFSNPYKRPCVFSTVPPLCISQHYKSNSTSSIWTTNTIMHPRLSELMLGTSVLLHAQLTGAPLYSGAPTTSPTNLNQNGSLGYRHLPLFDESVYTKIIPTTMPTVEYIHNFIKNVFEVGQFHPETCLITLLYINRFLSRAQIQLTANNYKPIFISALIVAQKCWDDTPLVNSDFNILYPPLNITAINILERVMLDTMEFDLVVTQAEYATYFFDCRLILEQHRQPLLLTVASNNCNREDFKEQQQFILNNINANNPTLEDLTRKDQILEQYEAMNAQRQFQLTGVPVNTEIRKHTPFHFIDRAQTQRIHLSDYYTRKKAEYKKTVMTPELIEITEKYRVVS